MKISEIDWIEAADYYACLHVGARSHLLRRSLSDLEEDLDPNVFCRVHRSSIVNLERVQGLKLRPGRRVRCLARQWGQRPLEPPLSHAVAGAAGQGCVGTDAFVRPAWQSRACGEAAASFEPRTKPGSAMLQSRQFQDHKISGSQPGRARVPLVPTPPDKDDAASATEARCSDYR